VREHEADFDQSPRVHRGLPRLKRMSSVDSKSRVVSASVFAALRRRSLPRKNLSGLIVINTVGRPLSNTCRHGRRQMQLAHQPMTQTDRLMALDERCNHRLLIDKERLRPS